MGKKLHDRTNMNNYLRENSHERIRFKWIASQIIGERVFDMGSSSATLHQYLIERFPRKKILGIDKEMSWKTDIIHDLNKPFPKRWSADCIVAGEVIEHLTNPYGFLSECYRILNRNGRMIITTPNINSIKVLFGVMNEHDDHIFMWSLDWLCRLMKRAGFEIIHKEYVNENKRLLVKILGKCIPTARRKLYIVGKKVM